MESIALMTISIEASSRLANINDSDSLALILHEDIFIMKGSLLLLNLSRFLDYLMHKESLMLVKLPECFCAD